MSNLYYAAAYKNKIINLLLKNKDLISLINPIPSECSHLSIVDVLLGGAWVYDGKQWEEQGHIFDYNFVSETTTEKKTFLFVETDIDSVRQNMFVDFNLYIGIFTSKNLVRITDESVPNIDQIRDMGYFASTYANRIDVLCDIVDGILNGNNKVEGIGTINPAAKSYCSLYIPSSKYYGKCLKYHISNLNETENHYND